MFVFCRSSSGQHPVRSGDCVSVQSFGPHLQGKIDKLPLFAELFIYLSEHVLMTHETKLIQFCHSIVINIYYYDVIVMIKCNYGNHQVSVLHVVQELLFKFILTTPSDIYSFTVLPN